MPQATVNIKKGREKSILNGHPWIFSGSITHAENAEPGDIVTVRAHDGQFLARGYWNPQSQIQVRILTWEKEQGIDSAFWMTGLIRAAKARGLHRMDVETIRNTAQRVVNAENDYLPGLIIDRYGEYLVLQALTLGIDARKHEICAILTDRIMDKVFGFVRGIYERSDVDVRGKEGLPQTTDLLLGEEPSNPIVLDYAGVKKAVNVYTGHKTGDYLDQQQNQRILFNLIDHRYDGDCRILNLFSYTGGFSVEAMGAGDDIHIINVDTSADALKLAKENVEHNSQYSDATNEFVQKDVFDYLREAVKRGDQHDIVVCDPPKFAHNKKQVDKASRGYKDINLNAFKLVKSGGYLMTFSCSGAISPDLFQKIVFGALADSGRQAQIVQRLGPSDDHPVALTFPEGAYLKGLLLRVY